MSARPPVDTPRDAGANAPAPNRLFNELVYTTYARIVTRKHGIAIPTDISALSDEELERRLATVRDLAHLPPV